RAAEARDEAKGELRAATAARPAHLPVRRESASGILCDEASSRYHIRTLVQRRPLATLTKSLAATILVIVGIAVYANSLGGVLIFDDIASITENRSIHDLSHLSDVLSPPNRGEAVSGR